MGKRSRKMKVKGGWFIFLFVNATLAMLVLSPVIPNLIGEYNDNQLLNGADARINEYRKGEMVLHFQHANGSAMNGTGVIINQTRHEFIFGCTFFNYNSGSFTSAQNDSYNNYFENLFNLAVLPFYWSGYEPQQGVFPSDGRLDEMVKWCRSKNITTKGHPLTWRNPTGYPNWLPDDDGAVVDLLQNRIENLTSSYSGRIDIWDVVNEPTHLPTFGNQPLDQFVSNCFAWAENSDPDVPLTINEYGILGHDFGYGEYYNLVDRLLDNDVPIDYIGLQGREPRSDWIPATEIWDTLEAYKNLGLPIHITEFTVPSASVPITNSWKKGLWDEGNQAEYAARVYKTCFSHPGVEALIWWDLYDGMSWVTDGGLIGHDWMPKPVYERLDNLINNEWHTVESIITNSNGTIRLDGFYGTYNISVPSLGEWTMRNITKGMDNEFLIILP
ncbi:MAG: endo-1,4-beta-xylanase [Candidatus Hodarchaeota archaeon]